MTTIKQGTVVLVRFPFSDQSGHKKRPALVISTDWVTDIRGDHILAGITTRARYDTDEVAIVGRDVREAGLHSESVVKAGSIFTIHEAEIIRRIGTLPRGTLNRVIDRVKATFEG